MRSKPRLAIPPPGERGGRSPQNQEGETPPGRGPALAAAHATPGPRGDRLCEPQFTARAGSCQLFERRRRCPWRRTAKNRGNPSPGAIASASPRLASNLRKLTSETTAMPPNVTLLDLVNAVARHACSVAGMKATVVCLVKCGDLLLWRT